MTRRLRHCNGLLILQISYRSLDYPLYASRPVHRDKWRDAKCTDLTEHRSPKFFDVPEKPKTPKKPGPTGRFRYRTAEEGLALQIEEYVPWKPGPLLPRGNASPPGYEEFQWRDATIEDITVHRNCEMEIVS